MIQYHTFILKDICSYSKSISFCIYDVRFTHIFHTEYKPAKVDASDHSDIL